LGVLEDLPSRSVFDKLSAAHDGDRVAHALEPVRDLEVMHEQDGREPRGERRP
jgi:hypothetical protein